MLFDNGIAIAAETMMNAANVRENFDLRNFFMNGSPYHVNHKTTNLPEIVSPPKKGNLIEDYILNH